MSGGTPGPLSSMTISSGSEMRSETPCTAMRMPGRKAVENLISGFCVRSSASAAFFTRLRKTWISWSRLP